MRVLHRVASHWRRGVLAATLLTGALGAAPAAAAADWVMVLQEQGVTVSQKEIPGRPLPMLRAVAIIDATPLEILAVLQDLPRHCEWMHNCATARLLEQLSANERYLYNRTDVPWPAKDRDVVLRSKFEIFDGGREVVVTIRATTHAKAPHNTDAVRIAHLRSSYRLTRTGDGRTRVVYQVDSDPGGSIPDWLVARESKEVPLNTLVNLRRQVRRTRGSYADVVAAWQAG